MKSKLVLKDRIHKEKIKNQKNARRKNKKTHVSNDDSFEASENEHNSESEDIK